MSTIGWLALVVAGIALGFGVGRLWSGRKTKLAEIEREREQARAELGNYRAEVSAHFERTAELFDQVTADYRSLYEHLALSARQLGAIQGEPAERSLQEPEQRRLGPAATTAAAGEAEPPATEDAPEATETEAKTEAETDTEQATETPETPSAAETPADASPRRGDS